MSKHTPGPWEFTYDGDTDPPSAVYAGEPGDEAFIANLVDGLPPTETYANARLIAAAPELLDALRTALEIAPNDMLDTVWGAEARAAIAKAEGTP